MMCPIMSSVYRKEHDEGAGGYTSDEITYQTCTSDRALYVPGENKCSILVIAERLLK